MKTGMVTTVSPLCIRLLGAVGTGKTQLASELAAALSVGPHTLARPFTVLDDPALHAPDQESHAGPTLLMGLDLPAPHALCDARQTTDRALRAELGAASIPYQVVYGHGAQRLKSALRALDEWLPGADVQAEGTGKHTPWVWACDNCSDPQCERRLLSDLLDARTAAS